MQYVCVCVCASRHGLRQLLAHARATAVCVNLAIFVWSTNELSVRMLKIQIPMLCGQNFVLYACVVHSWRFKFCKIDANRCIATKLKMVKQMSQVT